MRASSWLVCVGVFTALCLVASACSGGGGEDSGAAPEPTAAPASSLASGPVVGSSSSAVFGPVGSVLAEADGGASVWSGSAEGVVGDDVGIRSAEVSVDEVRIEGVAAEEWAATVELGSGYEVGWAGDAGIDGELDVSLPLPGGASAGDVVFVWFSSGGVDEYVPGLYDPVTGLVTASVPAGLLTGEDPGEEGVAAPAGGLVVKAGLRDWLDDSLRRVKVAAGKVKDAFVEGAVRVVGEATEVWDGAKWVVAKGAERFVDGVRHVWNGAVWVVKAMADMLERGWIWFVDRIQDFLNSLTGRTRPQCSGSALIEEGESDRGAPGWAEVSKEELGMVHVCKHPAGDEQVTISLKSNRQGAALVQVPDNAAELNVELQSDEWTRRTLADIGSLWLYPNEGPQTGYTPILLLGGTQLDYTLERPGHQELSARVRPAAYQSKSIALFNALTAAFPVIREAVHELVALFNLGKECWAGLDQRDSMLVGALVDCLVGVFEHYFDAESVLGDAAGGADRIKDEFLQTTGSELGDRAAAHIDRHSKQLTQTVRKLKSIASAAKSAGGWVSALGGLIVWGWDLYHDSTDTRILKYSLQPDNNNTETETDTTTTTPQPPTTTQTPTAPATDSYTTISAGRLHSCAVTTAGVAKCWGYNDYEQTDVPDGSYMTISAGHRHSCAVTTAGAAKCWGDNGYGQTDVPDGSYMTISAGWDHSCAVTTAGVAKCWGYNRYEQTDVPDGSYTTISAGGGHSCAVTTAGVAKCWGYNRYGQTGVPDGSYTTISAGHRHSCAVTTAGVAKCWGRNDQEQTDVPDGSYTTISAGHRHSCAVTTAGVAKCWGRNDQEQTDVPDGSYTTISAGWEHSCAVTTAGVAKCWGDNDYEQTDVPDGSYTTISAGWEHSCAVTTAGVAKCWGDNDDEQTDVPDGSYMTISAGHRHSCAVTTAGVAKCWGDNDYEQTDVPDGSYTTISAGWEHSCAVTTAGAAECWGHNRGGGGGR